MRLVKSRKAKDFVKTSCKEDYRLPFKNNVLALKKYILRS